MAERSAVEPFDDRRANAPDALASPLHRTAPNGAVRLYASETGAPPDHDAEGTAPEGFWAELFETLDAYTETLRDARHRIAQLKDAVDERDRMIAQLENTCHALRSALQASDFGTVESGTLSRTGPPGSSNGSGTWQKLQELEGRAESMRRAAGEPDKGPGA